MAGHPEPSLDELLWTCAAARLVLGADMNIQAPPNLSYDEFPRLLDAGINDWGGVSPVTIDHVNPEAPWPEIERLRRGTQRPRSRAGAASADLPGVRRRPAALVRAGRGDGGPAARRRRRPGPRGRLVGGRLDVDSRGRGERRPGAPRARADRRRAGGSTRAIASSIVTRFGVGISPGVREALAKVAEEVELDEDDVTALFEARGESLRAVLRAADELRREVCGDTVSYVVTRNINYTNVCYFRCGFCAFSKGKLAENLRGPAYLVPIEEIVRRCREAWERGAVEVCLQGGIHPGFTGDYYIEVCEAIKAELPGPPRPRLLRARGLAGSGHARRAAPRLPRAPSRRRARLAARHRGRDPRRRGQARPLPGQGQHRAVARGARHRPPRRPALDDDDHVRLGRGAAQLGAPPARDLRDQQKRTGGFTEFVPLPFVHMEAPIYLKGLARPGPTFREAVLMHAVARLALHPAHHERAGLLGEARRRRGRVPLCARARTTSAAR